MSIDVSQLEYQAACHFSSETLANLFTRAFEGYVGGEVSLSAESVQHFIASQGINLVLSQIVLSEGEAIALAFVARRGWTSRLATMGVVPKAQHQGLGTVFMKQLIAQAKARADRVYELEVIEQNPAGVKLYEKVGFKKLRRLVSLELENPQAEAMCELESVDIAEAASFVAYHAPLDLPWQVGAFNLFNGAEPSKAFRIDDAVVVFSDPEADTIRLHNVTVARQRQGLGTRLLQSLFAKYPAKIWRIPALCPEEYQPFFKKQGFTLGELSQFQMRLDLGSKS